MKVVPLLDQVITQAEFAELVGLSEARVSQLFSEGALARGDTARNLLLGYCERLRDQAAGRLGSEVGGLDLVQERAALAREQRIAQELKNAVSRGEFAPVGLLADVLGQASGAIVAKFDQLEGALRKACPGVEDVVMTTVLNVVASARNEWIRSTSSLVEQQMRDALEAAEDEPAQVGDLDDDGLWNAPA